MFRLDLTVRYHETDQMGVVHHSNYARWFENARVDMMRAYGMPYSEMEKRSLFSPVLELRVKYIRPARFEDSVSILARVAEATAVRTVVMYTVVTPSGVVLATGETRHCYVGADFRPVSLAKAAPELLAKMLSMVEEASPDPSHTKEQEA